jgi:inosine-uridine nucleoside N-ribohydrolase
MTKILLDTDIGSDIDDALCLAYLLAQPECEDAPYEVATTVDGERFFDDFFAPFEG